MVTCIQKIEDRLENFMKHQTLLGNNYIEQMKKAKRSFVLNEKRIKSWEFELLIKAKNALQIKDFDGLQKILWKIIKFPNRYQSQKVIDYVIKIIEIEEYSLVVLGLHSLAKLIKFGDFTDNVIILLQKLWQNHENYKALILLVISQFDNSGIKQLFYSNFLVDLLNDYKMLTLEEMTDYSYAIVNICSNLDYRNLRFLLNSDIFFIINYLFELKREKILENCLESSCYLLKSFEKCGQIEEIFCFVIDSKIHEKFKEIVFSENSSLRSKAQYFMSNLGMFSIITQNNN